MSDQRTVEYTDEDGRTVYRTYRKPEPSYLKLHDETGQPWQVSVTTDGELRTTKLDINDEYGEITFGDLSVRLYTTDAALSESVQIEQDGSGDSVQSFLSNAQVTQIE